MNSPTSQDNQIIFFGNGPLADHALKILEKHFKIVFHAKTKDDLETAKSLKSQNPSLHGILASFGVLIKEDVLDLFEPEGILNIHPSDLPRYRGASPIESAILNGDNTFSVSIMKLVKKMDAGPIYHQITIIPNGVYVLDGDLPYRDFIDDKNCDLSDPNLKSYLYKALSELGANWLVDNLNNLPEPSPQDDKYATFTTKFDKSMSLLSPETDTAAETLRKIQAFQGFPKPKYTFYGQKCIILAASPTDSATTPLLPLKCQDGQILSITSLQPEGKRPMDAKSFLNGYAK